MDKMAMYQLAEMYYPQASVVNDNKPLSDEDAALVEKLAQSIAQTLLED